MTRVSSPRHRPLPILPPTISTVCAHLIAARSVRLSCHTAAFCILQHLNREDIGGGKNGLVRWYRSLGFEVANDVLPMATGKRFHPRDMICSIADLDHNLS
jgi:hypothetical protein